MNPTRKIFAERRINGHRARSCSQGLAEPWTTTAAASRRGSLKLGACMLPSFTAIVLFDVAGDFCRRLLGVPIPGPVIGMALLLLALILRGRLPNTLDRAATGLLSYLPMLFVPAGVGMMAHFDLIKAQWPALIAGVVGSSVLAVAATALTMCAVERVQETLRKASGHSLTPQLVEVTHDADPS